MAASTAVEPKEKKKTNKPKAPLAHPSYFEMISDAIVTLKERMGSSQHAIGKFMEAKQKDRLPPNFRKLLLVQLRKLSASGRLTKIKNSYKLPSSAAAAKPAATKPKPSAAASAKPKSKPVAATVAKPKPKAKSVASAVVKPKISAAAAGVKKAKTVVAKTKVVSAAAARVKKVTSLAAKPAARKLKKSPASMKAKARKAPASKAPAKRARK